MLNKAIKVMMSNYYNDHDGNYMMSLEVLIDKIREGYTFKPALEYSLKFSEEHLENFIRFLVSSNFEKYGDKDLDLVIEKTKKDFLFTWVFDEMENVYNQYGNDGLFQLFFVKYKQMKDERMGLNNDDEDEED